VWGLDDYQFLPLIWGASQLIGHPSILPDHIRDMQIVEEHADNYLYLGCIRFIMKVCALYLSVYMATYLSPTLSPPASVSLVSTSLAVTLPLSVSFSLSSTALSHYVSTFPSPHLLTSFPFTPNLYQMKSGVFAEHSPLLNDISAVPYWKKVNSGLLKMYYDDCLDKFPVTQHFLFGSLMTLNAAPNQGTARPMRTGPKGTMPPPSMKKPQL